MKNLLKAMCGGRGGFVLCLSVSLLLIFATACSAEVISFQNNWGQAGFNLVEQDNDGVEVVFSVTEMQLEEMEIDGRMMQNVIIPGVILPNDAGAPNLPGTGRFIAIPEGAWVDVELVEYRTEVFHDIDIAPAFIIPKDTDPKIVYEMNPDIYERDANYPAEPVLVSETIQMRGVDAVILGITPFQYNPVTRDLTVYQDIRVRVNYYGGSGHFGEDRLRSRWWEPILEQNLLNYASLPQIDFKRSRQTDETDVEYLIIVPDDPDFLAWADTLKQWRNEQGILTGITTLTEIGGNNTTLIENYINNAYLYWDPAPVAVLLLSDYQSSGDLYGITSPTWNNYCKSDNIYADIDGDDLPDLNIARICAQDNQDLTNMIGKMLTYERTPVTDPNFYQRPLIAGGWQSDRWFILCCEVIYGYLQNELGKTPVRQYAGTSSAPSTWSTNSNTYMIIDYFGPSGLGYIASTPSYLTNWTGNATGINNAINAGAFLVQHRDHGEITGWSTPSYHNSDLLNLTNDQYPFVFSMNCLTGQYDYSGECFTEAFHRMEHGALGLISASEVSYSFVNDTYTWGIYDLMWPDFDPYYGSTHFGEQNLRPGFGNVSGKYYLAVSSWPYNPQNKDETNNLFHHHGDAFITLYSEVPQNLNVLHDAAILGGQSDFTVTADDGSLIGLSVDGVYLASAEGTGGPVTLTIEPQLPGATMRVTVTKANYYRYMADVPVVPPSGPYVTYNSSEINDAVVGNNNGQWDFSETIDLTVEVKNIGVSTATAVDVEITTDHAEVTILDGTEYYGDIAAGDSVSVTDGFQVQVSANVTDGELVTFTLSATSGTTTWESFFSLPLNAPVVMLDNLVILDPSGNNNGSIDPGETVDFTPTLLNDGHCTAENVAVTLSSNNGDITITGNPGSYGTMNPAATGSYTWTVEADAGMSHGTTVTFTLDITADDGYTTSEEFDLIVGDVRNLPTGPDTYGHLAWDNNDGGESFPFDWVEIAPSAGGSGTSVGISGDDDTEQLLLPFDFTYFGASFGAISVCSNGWMAMGNQTSTDYSNSGIPNSDGPANMIAPFWDDLNPYYGGEIVYYEDTNLHLFIVEWYQVPHYNNHANLETFEVILYDPVFYPTATGDGIIVVQYNQVMDESSVTFGIENYTETDGIQYGYNAAYDEHAWPVEAGRSITYTTGEAGTPDMIVDLTYVSGSPVPAGGGNIYYELYAENVGTSALNFDGWLAVSYEGGAPTTLVQRSFAGFQVGWTIDRDNMYFPVPSTYAAGNYVLSLSAGIYPDEVWDDDAFPFVKSGTADGGAFVPFVPDGMPDPFDQINKGDELALPTQYDVLGIYPNPFNPAATISYALPEAGKVALNVYDISGRLVARLVDGVREAGFHQATFDASGLASGVYIYRIQVADFTSTGKMILMK